MKLIDSAAAILRHSDGRILLQLRDDRPDIPFPDHWGCFGGSLDPGESYETALRRELAEELELVVREVRLVARLTFEAVELAIPSHIRSYFLVPISPAEHGGLVLHEGAAMRLFTLSEIMAHAKVSPYDRYALWLYGLSLGGDAIRAR